jgi:hypothetical protein
MISLFDAGPADTRCQNTTGVAQPPRFLMRPLLNGGTLGGRDVWSDRFVREDSSDGD